MKLTADALAAKLRKARATRRRWFQAYHAEVRRTEMPKKTPPRKRKPKDVTNYDLRGIRNDLEELVRRVEYLEQAVNARKRP